MELHLSDLDELAQKVRNSYSKNYLKEAIISYRSGAYRAAIITTWIAVCVDVIEKVRELSLGDDAAAKEIDTQLKGILPTDVNGMLRFERDILNFACDHLQLISVIEKGHLERLRDDRNICAHPTFSIDGSQFSPSPELTRAYIVQVANYLLINAPVKGKVVIDHLYDLIQSESFPEDDEKAFAMLASDSYLGRVRESSVRNLIIILLKRLFRDETSVAPDTLFRISAALGAIERKYSKIYGEVLGSKMNQMLAEANDKRLKRVFPFLIKRSESWGKIDAAVKIRIGELVSSMTVDDLISYKLTTLSSINMTLNDALQKRIERLEYADLYKLLEAKPAGTLKKYAIKIFIGSTTFSNAYKIGMRVMLPYGEFLVDEDMPTLFDGIFENAGHSINQILNAGGIDEVFSKLYRLTKNNISNHDQVWRKFWDKLQSEGGSYKALEDLLVKDGLVVEQVEPSIEDDDSIPF